jgi:hypothetical protein
MTKVAYGAVIAAAVALALGLTAEWLKSFDLGPVTPLVASNAAPAEVAAIAEIGSNRATTHHPVTMQITFCNRSGQEVRLLHIARVMHPGFEFRSVLPTANATLIAPMAPGERRHVTLEMEPVNTSGQYTVAVRYAWQRASDSQATVAVGPLIVTSPARAAVTRVGGPIIALFKDLALPIVLAVGAYLLQRQEKKRDEKRKGEEDERLHQQTTSNLLLPESHRFNTKYYLPLVRVVRNVQTETKPEKSLRDRLYVTMAALRRVRHISLQIGGLFLKDTEAEDLVLDLWSLCFAQVRTRLDATDVDAVMDVMAPNEGRSVFKARFPAANAPPATPFQTALVAVEKQFEKWTLDVFTREALPPLAAMQQVLEYEVNRPFSKWYEGRLEFPLKKLDESLQKLRALELSTDEMKKVDALAEETSWRAEVGTTTTKLVRYIERRKAEMPGSA